MKKTLLLAGADGRMGTAIVNLLPEFEQLRLAGKLGRRTNKETISVRELEKNTRKKFDVCIDFSGPEMFRQVVDACQKRKIALVSGTTGLTDADFEKLAAAAENIPVLWSANMSMGVAILKGVLASVGAMIDYDFHIEEAHHSQKKDKPSGTAIALAEALKTKNKKMQVEITSIRGGGLPGTHKVYMMGDEEFLTFEHQAFNRQVFARGALLAANWLAKKKPGLYKMEDVFEARRR